MNKEVLVCPELISNNESTSPSPDISRVKEVFNQIRFFESNPSQEVSCVVLRGSVASMLPLDGNLTFRSPFSDIDFFAITQPGGDNLHEAGYFFSVVDSTGSGTRDISVLYFTPQRLQQEVDGKRKGMFLSTKLLQIGFPVQGETEYGDFKKLVVASLLRNAVARRQQHYLTSSGAAKLVLEEDLFVEPWRLPSFQTTFTRSPQWIRNRQLILTASEKTLSFLVDEGIASRIKDRSETSEQVYEITVKDETHRNPRLSRALAMSHFVLDQIMIIHYSGRLFTPKRMQGFLLKLRTVLLNPTLSYDISSALQ